jgi:hypothetical protein
VASSAADYGEERVLTLVGSKQQTDLATELIKEVINEVGSTLFHIACVLMHHLCITHE